MNVPDGVSIRVVEDTDQVRTLIIPPEPSQQPLRLFLQLSFRPYFHNIDNEYVRRRTSMYRRTKNIVDYMFRVALLINGGKNEKN